MKFVFSDMNCEQLYNELSYIVKGYTHHVSEDGEINSIRLKGKDIVIRDSLNCLKIAEITFPDVQVGSILEYIITIPTLKLIKPDPWYFEKNIPVLYSEFKAYIPDNFTYIFSLNNIDTLSIKDSSFYDTFINYRFRYGNYMLSSRINLSGKMYRFVNKNVPVLEDPKTAQKINIHLKRVIAKPSEMGYEQLTHSLMITTWDDYDLRSPGQRKLLTYPPSYIIYYLPSWKELNEKLLKSPIFGLALIKFWDCDSIFNPIVQDNMEDDEKAKSIYFFVRNNMKWNNQYSLYADVSDGFFKTLYGKTGAKVNYNNIGNYFNMGEGNSSEINFILMYLLKKAKFTVSPVLVNTFDNEPVDKEIPQLKQFKTVLVLIEIDGNTLLLDAADPGSSFNSVSNTYDPDQMYVVRTENFGWLNELNSK
jgi:hypothetical protein